ncbi:MAG: hypothetical protein M0R39_05400 [Prolixibacteraceae bacterium]|nr:hypothetical protein [Prolixibacteraceae bacterium]
MKTLLKLLFCFFLFTLLTGLLYASEPGDFAAAAGITGGSGGKSIVVTNLNDSGPGSLRNALNTHEPRMITFKPGLTGILNIPGGHMFISYGNFTLDGAGAKITISGNSIFMSSSAASNCIIKNLTFGNTTAKFSAITIVSDAHTILVDHCTFYNNSSGQTGNPIGIWNGPGQDGITGITISWCHFKVPNKKSVLIGSADQTLKKNTRISLHHNWFDGIDARNPRVHGGTLVHAWNNYISNWSEYGVGASALADVLLENNIFENANNTNGAVASYGNIDASSVNVSGNYLIGVPVLQTIGTFPKDQLTYKATLEVADDALKSRIMAGAGAP